MTWLQKRKSSPKWTADDCTASGKKKYQITSKPAMFFYNFKLNILETLYLHSTFIIFLLHAIKFVLFGNKFQRNLNFSKTGSFSNKMSF